MNFDGKALVLNTITKAFSSEHGYASVRNSEEQSINNLCAINNKSNALVTSSNRDLESDFDCVKTYLCGTVPYSIQCSVPDKIINLVPQSFSIIKSRNIYDSKTITYIPETTYISKLQPTNIKYNHEYIVVKDLQSQEQIAKFEGISINVNSKIEVIVPDKGTNFANLSIVIQKNSFIEIQLSSNVVGVVNLPNDLSYSASRLKGTFSQSGNYSVRIIYPDGEQLLNIIVPYYQRLL